MAVTGPDFVALQVRDLEASARFYTERLGLARAAVSPPGAVVFATEPVPFAVREPMVDLDATDRLGWGVALWLKADDVDKLHDDLASHGVTIVTAPSDGPFGRTFAFADPDGYVVTLHG
ncbi:VOC family protein [Actinoallomurus acaciae]|uniref:VOC family protein n=1 Tax=Actinoallomurus acaciae TaxID=502577 RepID=A0ABV5YJS4_9ACTN